MAVQLTRIDIYQEFADVLTAYQGKKASLLLVLNSSEYRIALSISERGSRSIQTM